MKRASRAARTVAANHIPLCVAATASADARLTRITLGIFFSLFRKPGYLLRSTRHAAAEANRCNQFDYLSHHIGFCSRKGCHREDLL
jgi:hypothetical protein